MTLDNKNKVVTTSKNDTEVYSSRLKLSGKLISQFYGQKHPTAFSPLGGASVPTQEKKKSEGANAYVPLRVSPQRHMDLS